MIWAGALMFLASIQPEGTTEFSSASERLTYNLMKILLWFSGLALLIVGIRGRVPK